MLQVEADLGCRLDWVGGAHYDTDNPHVQFLWNGRTEAGIIVQLDRGYLTHGLRARAAEILALYGGYSCGSEDDDHPGDEAPSRL
jgi:type IV secretory pathway VirD2 relaxase